MLTYYSDEDHLPDKEIKVDFGKESKYEVYLLDEDHNEDLLGVFDSLQFTMKQNTCILVKEAGM